jgi:hypothetical protein
MFVLPAAASGGDPVSPRAGAPNTNLADVLIFMQRNFKRDGGTHRVSGNTIHRHFPSADVAQLVELGILGIHREKEVGVRYWIRPTAYSYSQAMVRNKAQNARMKVAA